MFRKTRSLLIFLFFLQSFAALAQTSPSTDYDRNSPYSRFGIGEIVPQGSVRNLGMGTTGISQSHPEFYNNLNPALLPGKRSRSYDSAFSILDGSIFGELRKSEDDNSTYSSGTVSFNSINYALPLNRRWTTSVGIRPFTDVSYVAETTIPVAGSPSDSAKLVYTGSGGIYQAEFSNGVRINKYFNAGLSASYLFGSVSNRSYSYLINVPSPTLTGINDRVFYSGFLFRPGVVFRKPVKRNISIDSTIFMNLGATYDFLLGTKADQEVSVETRTSSNLILSQNSITSNDRDITIPGTLKLGLSFDQGYRWNIAADFTYSNWKNFKGLNPAEEFQNSFTLAVGGEFGFVKKEHSNELESVKIHRRQYVRTGFIYSRTPYYFRGEQINDLALTFGYSFNVGSLKKIKNSRGVPRSKVNLAVIVGQRGTLKNFLVKDQYIRAYLGLTINEKWFIRRRVD